MMAAASNRDKEARTAVRVRRMIGREQRDCPTCETRTWFEVYQSWDRVRRFSRARGDLRQVARCEVCSYRVLLDA